MERYAPCLGTRVCGVALPAQSSINIPFEAYTLPNGLNVVLSIDRTTPTVAVNIWYHVGSKNEMPGRTGFAHLFEHVMFTGSGHVPYGLHDRLTEGAGGMNNGTTSNDITTYYETVPSNYLETMLWIEADRMGFLLDSLDLAKLNAQRDIVKNERRQRVDNQPYGRVFEILSKAMYPASHPYSWPVIGSMEDLSAASEEDVKNFFRLYYAPNNAFLTIVGDFDPAQAKAWVTKYFGDIPRGNPINVRQRDRSRSLGAAARVRRSRAGAAGLCSVADGRRKKRRPLRAVGARRHPVWSPDGPPDQGAGVSTSRRPLLFQRGQNSSEDVGEFLVTITPRPGHSLTDLETAADAVIERLKREGPDGRRSAEGDGRRRTFVHTRPRVESRQSVPACEWSRNPRRSRPLPH